MALTIHIFMKFNLTENWGLCCIYIYSIQFNSIQMSINELSSNGNSIAFSKSFFFILEQFTILHTKNYNREWWIWFIRNRNICNMHCIPSERQKKNLNQQFAFVASIQVNGRFFFERMKNMKDWFVVHING